MKLEVEESDINDTESALISLNMNELDPQIYRIEVIRKEGFIPTFKQAFDEI